MPIHLSLDPPDSGWMPLGSEATDCTDRTRIPCLLLIDAPNPGDENAREIHLKTLQMFEEMLARSACFREILDVCVMSAGVTPQLELDFVPASEFRAPSLTESPQRNLNVALDMALTKLENQRRKTLTLWDCVSPPLLFLISGGHASDRVFEQDVHARLHAYISKHDLAFVPMKLGDADTDYLKSFYPPYFSQKILDEPSASNFRDAMPALWKSPQFHR